MRRESFKGLLTSKPLCLEHSFCVCGNRRQEEFRGLVKDTHGYHLQHLAVTASELTVKKNLGKQHLFFSFHQLHEALFVLFLFSMKLTYVFRSQSLSCLHHVRHIKDIVLALFLALFSLPPSLCPPFLSTPCVRAD